jgi:hypothetical protein
MRKPALERWSGGGLKCLRYAHENGCPWDEKTCSEAAAGGHLECLRYAHENGCPWNKETCYCAVADGRLDCLKYAHENGCPWDVDQLREMKINNGYVKTYLMEHLVTSKGNCVKCALERKRFHDIDLSDPSILAVPGVEVLATACRHTLQAMERAYVDPRYSLCIDRLERQFQEFQELSSIIQSWKK